MPREDDEFERIIDREYTTASEYPYDPMQVHAARHPANRYRMQVVERTWPVVVLGENDWMAVVAESARSVLLGEEVLHYETLFGGASVGWMAVVARSDDVVS
jgi:hypothetical protein